MLCVKSDRPIDPIVVSVIREIDTVAKDLRLSYCLIGAMARDLLLRHVFGLNPGRATRAQLKALLSATGVSEQLVNDMVKALHRREDAVTYAEQLFDQFNQGFSS